MKIIRAALLCLLLFSITASVGLCAEQTTTGWPEIAFPTLREAPLSGTDEILIALSLSIDLTQPAGELIGHATLALNTDPIPEGATSAFYLNPGLRIESLKDSVGNPVAFKQSGATVLLSTLPQRDRAPYSKLFLTYRGQLQAHRLFDPPDLAVGTLHGDLWVLPPESLWYPYWPGQAFTGRLVVKTPAGRVALSTIGEEKILEREGVRTSFFAWDIPIRRLGVAASRWKPAQIETYPLVMELLTPPERSDERGLLYTLTLMKMDFFSRAYYPLPWTRMTLVGRPDDLAPADAHGLIVLPSNQQEVHVLGHPLLDRMLARQWLGELLRFAPDNQDEERGWVEFAARQYLEEIFSVQAQENWSEEGRWLTRLAQPNIPRYLRVAWVLRMIEGWTGKDAFWELNQEFFQRYLYQRVTMKDYLDVAEEIFYESPSGPQLRSWAEPWLYRSEIPTLSYSSEIEDTSPARLRVDIVQQAESLWKFETELEIVYQDEAGQEIRKRKKLLIDQETERFYFEAQGTPTQVVLDPDWKILAKRIERKGWQQRQGDSRLD